MKVCVCARERESERDGTRGAAFHRRPRLVQQVVLGSARVALGDYGPFRGFTEGPFFLLVIKQYKFDLRAQQVRGEVLAPEPPQPAHRRLMATDVCVPVSRLADCIAETKADLAQSFLFAPIVGHVGGEGGGGLRQAQAPSSAVAALSHSTPTPPPPSHTQVSLCQCHHDCDSSVMMTMTVTNMAKVQRTLDPRG